MEYITLNLQGRSHIHDNRPCEDAIAIDPAGVFCLADGVSNSAYGGKGAEYRVDRMMRWLSSPKVRVAFAEQSVGSIRAHVCNQLAKIDQALCESVPCSRPEDFASTLLCAVEVSDSTICLLHCGDGVIFGFPNAVQATPVILSGPDNTPSGAVYYAGHPEQRARMRVLRILKEDYSRILLCTDGFSDPYFKFPFDSNLDLLENLVNASSKAEFEEISAEDHANISDDISCIMIYALEHQDDAATSPELHPAVPKNETFVQDTRKLPATDRPSSYSADEQPVQIERGKSERNNYRSEKRVREKSSKNGKHVQKGVWKPYAAIALLILVAVGLMTFAITTVLSLNELKTTNENLEGRVSVLETRVEQITRGNRIGVFPE